MGGQRGISAEIASYGQLTGVIVAFSGVVVVRLGHLARRCNRRVALASPR